MPMDLERAIKFYAQFCKDLQDIYSVKKYKSGVFFVSREIRVLIILILIGKKFFKHLFGNAFIL